MHTFRRMGRYLIILVALLCLASCTAFFLYVPVLPVIASALVLLGFALMFALGVQVGHPRRPT